MIIHSYLTDGFFEWAKLFLESYKYFNGEQNLIILSTRNLNEDQIKSLKKIYDRLIIENEKISVYKLAKENNIDVNLLRRYKDEIEHEHVTEENKVWKLLISADNRVKSVYNTIKKFQETTYSHLLHFDIDMYIRSPLTWLFKFVKDHEISMRFRLKSKDTRKVLGSLQGFSIQRSLPFLERWIYYIDKIPPTQKPMGYGQSSCYYAFRDLQHNYVWGDIPLIYASPHKRPEDRIWSGNTTDGKTKNLEFFRENFKKLKKEIPL